MPTYEYSCIDCGSFSKLRPMSRRDDPAYCPRCESEASRLAFQPTAFGRMSSSNNQAMAINERNQHAPTTSGEYKSRHGAGCSCCSGSGKLPSRTRTFADGSKTFAGSRPWQISH